MQNKRIQIHYYTLDETKAINQYINHKIIDIDNKNYHFETKINKIDEKLDNLLQIFS
jgi:hypothetical protein